MRNCPPQVLAQIGKRGERIAIPGNEPYRVAIGVGKSAKTVVLQLKEPIRVAKGNGPADQRERLDYAAECARLLLSHRPGAPGQIPCPGVRDE